MGMKTRWGASAGLFSLTLLVLTAPSARSADFPAIYVDLYNDAVVSFEKCEKDPDSPIAREYALNCSEKALQAYRAAGTEIERYSALVLQSRCLGFLGRRVKRAVAGS